MAKVRKSFGFVAAAIIVFIVMLVAGTVLNADKQLPLVAPAPAPVTITTALPAQTITSVVPAKKPTIVNAHASQSTVTTTSNAPSNNNSSAITGTTTNTRQPNNIAPTKQPHTSSMEPVGTAIVLRLPLVSATVSVTPLLPIAK